MRRALIIVPLALVAAVVVGLPVAALTNTSAEQRVRKSLGLGALCVPDGTKASRGWREEPALPAVRHEPKGVAIAGKVYLAGGLIRTEDGSMRSLSSFTRFDPRTGRYEELAPMPAPLDHASTVAYRGDVYVVGGFRDAAEGAAASFSRYSPGEDRWTELPPIPTARAAAAAVVIGDRLYVAGGQIDGRPLASLEIFDFEKDRWSRGADMPAGREHVAGAAAEGGLYLIGGRNRDTDALGTVERYDPAGDRWEGVDRLPVAAGGLEAVSVDGRVIAIGGGDDREGTVTDAVQRYDPASGRWSELAPMPTARHGFGAAAVGGRIYTIGGSDCALYAATDRAESFEVPR